MQDSYTKHWLKHKISVFVSDTVYIESQRPDLPYYICTIKDFKRVRNFESVGYLYHFKLSNCCIFLSSGILFIIPSQFPNGTDLLSIVLDGYVRLVMFPFGQLFQSKKDNITCDVVWLYRPCEIPVTVYQLLLQDRNAEKGTLLKAIYISFLICGNYKAFSMHYDVIVHMWGFDSHYMFTKYPKVTLKHVAAEQFLYKHKRNFYTTTDKLETLGKF